MIPFVIFFPSAVKLFSVLVYFLGLIGGLILYRLRNKVRIGERMKSEDRERDEQERKEEFGKWK